MEDIRSDILSPYNSDAAIRRSLFITTLFSHEAEVIVKERIMLVEDELITALDIQRMLERVGYQVSATVSSGEDAVEKVKSIMPDLILMDIFLSEDMDGIEASDLILKEIDVPVIFLTANADSNTIKRADMIRHYGYLIKPIKQNELNSIISTALQRHDIESKRKNPDCTDSPV